MGNTEIVESQLPTFVKIIMACHNRADVTKRFFEYFIKARKNGFEFSFLITNDGSTDETQSVIDNQPFPVKSYFGSGNLYWAKSMAIAESLIEKVPDGILWVNDDLVLYPEAFEKLLSALQAHPDTVLVGQVANLDSGECIYGGYKRTGRHPLVLNLIFSEDTYELVDTFNGNFVYIPIQIRLAVGSIDSNYEHAYADCDYGYRVRKSGYKIVVIPGFIGETNNNIPSWPSGRVAKLRQLNKKKYNPIKSQFRFFLLHRPRFGFFEIPIFFLRPYLRILILNSRGTQ
jgi:GT2 family glycosyltransferase